MVMPGSKQKFIYVIHSPSGHYLKSYAYEKLYQGYNLDLVKFWKDARHFKTYKAAERVCEKLSDSLGVPLKVVEFCVAY